MCLCLSAYDGPYEDSPESPDGRVKTIQVLNVTPDSTKTEETDSDNDIPTIGGEYRTIALDMLSVLSLHPLFNN